MEFLIAIFFLWLFVTLIGHGSWVVLQRFFRLFTETPSTESRRTDTPRPIERPLVGQQTDIEACDRVLDRLVSEQLIEPSRALELRQQIQELQSRTWARSGILPPPTPDSTGQWNAERQQPAAEDSAAVSAETVSAEPVIMAKLSDAPVTPIAPPVRQISAGVVAASSDEPPGPVLTKSEMIQSFLAAHNIRWGELVAGILIVGCSIGLVISLWKPLVDANPVIPSLIFLTANASIFGAGLYTLSRWRVRHTSRAVLYIATLLVPLSVLIGLATAGTSDQAVRLTDPVTLVAICVAGAVYSWLLWLGGRALFRRPYAPALVLAVAGPSVVLPLMPAAVRTFGEHAGWLVGVGALAIISALVWMLPARRNEKATAGVAAGRNRLLMMSVCGFTLAVLIAYAGFLLRDSGIDAMLPIAIASVPALVGIAGAGRWVMLRARRETQSMIGAIACVIAIGLTWAVLPPSMKALHWVWLWGAVLSTSSLAAGCLLKQPRWLAAATLPVGLAATVSSPIWLGGEVWQSVPLWRRFVGGEPMLAAAMMALVVAAISQVFRDRESRRWVSLSAAAWAGFALLGSAILAIGPNDLLGAAPQWSPTLVLAAGVVASVVAASRWSPASYATTGLSTLAWISVFRPFTLDVPLAWSESSTWMTTAISIAASLLVLAEFVPRWPRLQRPQQRALKASCKSWILAAVTAAVFAAVIACLFVGREWSESATCLALATILIFWASTASRSLMLVRIAQLGSVSLAIVVGYGYGPFSEELFTSEAWRAARAPWAWSILAGVVTAVWFAVRELTKIDTPPVDRRLGFLRSRAARVSELVDGPTVTTVVAMIMIGTGWAFAALLSSVAESRAIIDESDLQLPLIAFTLAAGLMAWMQRLSLEEHHESNSLLAILTAIAAIIWVPLQLVGLLSITDLQQLIVATSLAAVGCAALRRYILPRFNLPARVADLPLHTAAILVASASAVLLNSGWLQPIRNQLRAEWLPTITVSAWWLIGSLALLFDARRERKASPVILSSLLAPAAVALVVPVYSTYSTLHPLVWIQVAAIASLAWVAISRWLVQHTGAVEPANRGSLWFIATVGLCTALLVSVSILFDIPALRIIFGPAGASVSLLAISLACLGRLPSDVQWDGGQAEQGTVIKDSTTAMGVLSRLRVWLLAAFPIRSPRLPWPIGLSLLAGQAAWLLEYSGLATGNQLIDVIAVIGCVAAFASLLRYGVSSMTIELAHATTVSLGVCVLTIVVGSSASPLLIAAGLTSFVIGGFLVAVVGRDPQVSKPAVVAARLLGWFVVFAGGYLLARRFDAYLDQNQFWMMLVAWLATWIVLWRLCCPDRDGLAPLPWRALPDTEFAVLALVAVVGESAVMINSGHTMDLPTTLLDSLLWIRVVAYLAVAVSTSARGNRKFVWPIAIGTAMAAVALVAVRLSIDADASWYQRVTVAMLTAGVSLATITHSLRPITQLSTRLCGALGGTTATKIGGLVRDVFAVSIAFAAIAGLVSVAMIAGGAPSELTPLAIGAVALAALAVVELAELSRLASMRHTAMTMVLVAIGLWASVASGEDAHPWLNMSMRWLVASVITIPTLLLVMPKVLGETLAARWHDAFRQAAVVVATTAGLSLGVMLAIEAVVRTAAGIPEVPFPLVIGTAVTLGILSALAALVSVLSGPESSWRMSLDLTDTQRQFLIVAAQAIAAVTWLHVFLCRPNWAFAGLREYWPYLVMGLSFVSVGVTEWARRQRDPLLADTLSQTSLYLPMIPVIGFWLSGSLDEWAFAGGKTPYALFLTIGAAYYIGLSAMWRNVIPKVAAMLLGNGAIWVVLVQTPNWGFLSHPQAWLIPPAVCVLVVGHLYRDRLEPVVSSGIRYASMLVIYISSTADILLQEIGKSIEGPIVLILLALAGMGAGVILRVRPFLYLGATFVFIGVTSMVWHATISMGANWPWWVFGITTGICLLAGLMAIEKNKPQLRRFASSLASWEA